jgi:hypothetical protein
MAFSLICIIGGLIQSGIAYPYIAKPKGWPVGSWAGSEKWAIYFIIGVLALIISAWHVGPLWGLLILLPASFVSGLILTSIFGRNIQTLALLGTPIACITYLLTL